MASALDDSLLFNVLQSRKQHFIKENSHLTPEDCERQWGLFIASAAPTPQTKPNAPPESLQSQHATSRPMSIPAKRTRPVRMKT